MNELPGFVQPLWYSFTFIFGACVASFLNVVIYRIPNELSVVKPDSHCPDCKTPIAWYDNIPCVSYLVLRGKCRACAVSFSPRYWGLEVLGGCIGLGLWYWLAPELNLETIFETTLKWLFWQGFIFALLALSWIDFEYLIIPDEISLFLVVLGLAGFGLIEQAEMIDRAIGAVAGGGFLLLVAGLGYLMYRREAMGMGDVKLLAIIGLFLGWRVLPLILFLSAIQAILAVALMTLASKVFKIDSGFVRTTHEVDAHFGETELYEHLDEPQRLAIPFGPFLALAAVEGLILGDAFFWDMIDNLLRLVMS